MNLPKTVLITGASGNLGGKLRRHLEGRCDLRLLDIAPSDPAVVAADLSHWDSAWADRFRGADAVVHLAADATAAQTWPKLIAPNVDAAVNAYEAAARAGVRRFVYASSNHVMGGYKDEPDVRLTTDLPPRPGTRYVVDGQRRDSTPYGSTKLFGERLGKCYADSRGLEVVAVRIGWVRHGGNRAQDLPPEREAWFRLMWLSDRDFCRLMECCLAATPPAPFVVVNGMSNNTGMAWDLDGTRRLVAFEPLDDVTRSP